MVWGLGFRVQGSLGSGYLESVQESALNPKPQLSSFCFCEASSVSLCTESHKPCKNGCAPSLEPLGIQSLWAAWCLRRPTGDPGPTAAVPQKQHTVHLISHLSCHRRPKAANRRLCSLHWSSKTQSRSCTCFVTSSSAIAQKTGSLHSSFFRQM